MPILLLLLLLLLLPGASGATGAAAWAPLWRADPITAPLLVLRGTDNARVLYDLGFALHRAVARRGIDARWSDPPGRGAGPRIQIRC